MLVDIASEESWCGLTVESEHRGSHYGRNPKSTSLIPERFKSNECGSENPGHAQGICWGFRPGPLQEV